MATPIDVNTLIAAITKAATDAIGKDVSRIAGFSQRQADGLARQAEMIADKMASGVLTDAARDFFLADLKQTARDFADALTGLLLVDIEKVWNAAVKTLWDAIENAVQVSLPRL